MLLIVFAEARSSAEMSRKRSSPTGLVFYVSAILPFILLPSLLIEAGKC